MTAKTFINLQKIFISHKCCSVELSVHQRILKKCIMVSTKILSGTTVFNMDDNKNHVAPKTGVTAAENSALP